MVLLIDNYDSFTYNLYQYIAELKFDVLVFRNDSLSTGQVENLKPDFIVISPGPGHPAQAGISVQVIKHFSGRIPILGICLGHQAICLSFGGRIEQAIELVHGKQSVINHNRDKLFHGIPQRFKAVRYHSLAVGRNNFPPCLSIDAYADDGTIMAASHNNHLTYGVQFHPESVLSEYGKKLLENFFNCRKKN